MFSTLVFVQSATPRTELAMGHISGVLRADMRAKTLATSDWLVLRVASLQANLTPVKKGPYHQTIAGRIPDYILLST